MLGHGLTTLGNGKRDRWDEYLPKSCSHLELEPTLYWARSAANVRTKAQAEAMRKKGFDQDTPDYFLQGRRHGKAKTPRTVEARVQMERPISRCRCRSSGNLLVDDSPGTPIPKCNQSVGFGTLVGTFSTYTYTTQVPYESLTTSNGLSRRISFEISDPRFKRYRIARRDDTGRLRQSQQANELQQEVNALRKELDFLIQTQRSLTQQPTLQASLSPPVVSQNYTPPRCRLPSDMPRFKRPTAEAQSTVQDFISVFERKLKADSYPTEKYVDALTACCHPEEADWVESSITHCQSWDEAKDRFLRHFIDEDMETLYAYELEGILKNPKESIHAFADRYLHAMRLAKADPNLKHVQVTHFLTRLSDQVRKDVNLVKATRPENVDTVSGIVRTLVTLYPPTKISAKPGSPTQALRWCSYHRSPAHSDEECQAQKRSDFHRPPATAKSGSTSQARRISTWCEHHKVNTHSTSECRLTNLSSTNATSSRVFPKSMLATSNATYAPTSQRCHKCNEVGHYANRCPKLTNAAPVPTRHSSALVSNQSSNQNGPTTAYQEPEAESKDPTVEDFYELFSKRPSNHLSQSLSEQTGIDYNSAFLVPIIFESVQLSAYIDSGASHSSVPQTLLQQIPHRKVIPPVPNSKTSLGAKDAYTPRLGSIDLPFTWDNKKFTHKFEISDPPAGVQVIIGRDLFTLLGITISGLPLPQPVNKPAEEELAQPTSMIDDVTEDHHLVSHHELTEAIQRNQAIPSNSFCNVPVAVVRLETGDHPPVYRRQYPIPFNVHGQVKEQIEEWVQTGKVTDAPIGCQYNNPLLVVPKKDLEGKLSKVRVCIDPRQLNKQLQADRFPLPLIKDIFSFFANSKIFSTIDLEQAYLQLPILPQHQPKTAFTWGNRHLMFVGTPFGICITASVLQRTMSFLFRGSECTYPFQDDLPVGSQSPEQHLKDLVNTINKLTAANLRIRLSKCIFFKKSIHLLGHTMSENGISIDSRKISSVVDWPIPTTGRQIEQYLGLINYFRDFIPTYSTIAAPPECLRKHTSLPVEKWSQHQLDSFNLLKNILTQAPFLSFPNFRKPFVIATDASDAGIGAVLYQLKDPCSPDIVQNRNWVMFSARAINSSEKNYSATKRDPKGFHYNNVPTNHSSALPYHPVPTDFAEPPSDVVPESERQGEIELSHLKGHFGVKATLLDLIKQGKFWPSMRTDIESQLKSCPACRRWTITKVGYHPLTAHHI
ncbi:hypothetical protein BASA83_006670 [Batrachochytrium salamandrivorans]|nr:hypothetical protein BASA83_006670 [Batrachochytrium salamandrivorans]